MRGGWVGWWCHLIVPVQKTSSAGRIVSVAWSNRLDICSLSGATPVRPRFEPPRNPSVRGFFVSSSFPSAVRLLGSFFCFLFFSFPLSSSFLQLFFFGHCSFALFRGVGYIIRPRQKQQGHLLHHPHSLSPVLHRTPSSDSRGSCAAALAHTTTVACQVVDSRGRYHRLQRATGARRGVNNGAAQRAGDGGRAYPANRHRVCIRTRSCVRRLPILIPIGAAFGYGTRTHTRSRILLGCGAAQCTVRRQSARAREHRSATPGARSTATGAPAACQIPSSGPEIWVHLTEGRGLNFRHPFLP